ncbi:MAG TPA: PD-(D/E)XK nuclease-like domain-containing protein, partial [Iamia sp.]
AGIAEIDADSWRTKAAKEARDEARAEGMTPLLTKDVETVQAMAKALRSDPKAAPFLAPGSGDAEQVLVWEDGETGVMRRAMLDWLPHQVPGRRVVIPDYKTCADAEPSALEKAMHNHGHHMQGDWYRAGAMALGLVRPDAAFVFICQEKEPPYLVTVYEPHPTAWLVAASKNRWAIDTYKQCTDTNTWPGYTTDVVQLRLPRWVEIQEGIEG